MDKKLFLQPAIKHKRRSLLCFYSLILLHMSGQIHVAVIKEIRQNAVTPISVAFEAHGQLVDAGFVPITLDAWATVQFKNIKAGVQCLIFESNDNTNENPIIVFGFISGPQLPLPDNTNKLARSGDTVSIKGAVSLGGMNVVSVAQSPTGLIPIPGVDSSLGHNLTGEIKT